MSDFNDCWPTFQAGAEVKPFKTFVFPKFGDPGDLGWLRRRLKARGMTNRAIKRTSISQMRRLGRFEYPSINKILASQPMTRWNGTCMEVEYRYGVEYTDKSNDLYHYAQSPESP